MIIEGAGLIQQLVEALKDAESHLDYCGYGDRWERECAESSKLSGKIAEALNAAEAAGFTAKGRTVESG